MMYEVDLAYAAGLIDGEGSIQILKTKGRHGEINPVYELKVDISNTDKRMLDWLEFHFGGRIDLSHRKKQTRTPCYRWQLIADNAMLFLISIRRYLVCKKKQVDIAMTFRETYRNKKKCCRYGTPNHILALREECYQRLRGVHQQFRKSGKWVSF